jgi:hypothetical protein
VPRPPPTTPNRTTFSPGVDTGRLSTEPNHAAPVELVIASLGKESRDAADRDDRFAILRPRPSHDCIGDIGIARGPVRRPQHAGWFAYSEGPAVAVDDAAHPAALRGHCLCSFAVLHTDMRAPHSATSESGTRPHLAASSSQTRRGWAGRERCWCVEAAACPHVRAIQPPERGTGRGRPQRSEVSA